MTNRIRRTFGCLILPLAIAGPSLAAEARSAKPRKPNIILILADDLGYGDLGFLHQNARSKANLPAMATPHLDRIASEGVVLRNHYTAAPVCAPARGTILTGQHQGHCAIRDNQFDKALPDGLTLASMLKHAGYHTAAIGKWGLAGKAPARPAHPMRRGFDEFFGYLNHRDGHVYYHDADHPLTENLAEIGDRFENVYDTDLFTARAKKYIVERAAKGDNGEPFFLYLAYTAVHNALNVPGNPYPAGYGKSGGVQWPLKPTPETRNTFIHPDYAGKSWTEPMKRYATMTRRLDDGVQDVVQTLRDLKIDDDTLIVFTSDNGPANEGGADPRLFESWGPFDGMKRDVFEGGVREPAFVYWPGHVTAGQTSEVLSGFHDWMPTFAEAAGLPAPAASDGISLLPALTGRQDKVRQHEYIYIEYNFDGAVRQLAGRDVLNRKGMTARGQQQLVRIGDFVGVRTDIRSADAPLRLYNVVKDVHQDHDLAKDPAHADLLHRMNALLVTARTPDSSVPRPYDSVPLPAVDVSTPVTQGKLACSLFTGAFPYVPDVATLKPASTAQTEGLSVPDSLPKDQPLAIGYSGYVTVPQDGTYTVNATSTGPLHVWLHDAHFVRTESAVSDDKPVTFTVPLRAGAHPVRITLLHTPGGGQAPSINLTYSSADVAKTDVPAEAFSTP